MAVGNTTKAGQKWYCTTCKMHVSPGTKQHKVKLGGALMHKEKKNVEEVK